MIYNIHKQITNAVLLGCIIVSIPSCAVGSFVGLDDLNLSGCTKGCNESNKKCLAEVTTACPATDACFDDMQACFSRVTQCSDDCLACKLENRCDTNQAAICNNNCSHMAKDCTDYIDTCVQVQKTCTNEQVSKNKTCATTLVSCITVCIKEAENVLKN